MGRLSPECTSRRHGDPDSVATRTSYSHMSVSVTDIEAANTIIGLLLVENDRLNRVIAETKVRINLAPLHVDCRLSPTDPGFRKITSG